MTFFIRSGIFLIPIITLPPVCSWSFTFFVRAQQLFYAIAAFCRMMIDQFPELYQKSSQYLIAPNRYIQKFCMTLERAEISYLNQLISQSVSAARFPAYLSSGHRHLTMQIHPGLLMFYSFSGFAEPDCLSWTPPPPPPHLTLFVVSHSNRIMHDNVTIRHVQMLIKGDTWHKPGGAAP